jgi:hypothetical protein
MEGKVTVLEEKLSSLTASNTILAVIVTSLQTHMGELEDIVMEDSNAEGDVVESSELSCEDPVENMVVIPVPAPSVVHTLVPINIPLEFIPPVLRSESTPSPPYVAAREDNPLHNGVLEYWAKTN